MASMKFRTLALALALSTGFTAMAASKVKHKTVVTRSNNVKRAKKALAKKVKPRKARKVARHRNA